jgi:hypothetical protein
MKLAATATAADVRVYPLGEEHLSWQPAVERLDERAGIEDLVINCEATNQAPTRVAAHLRAALTGSRWSTPAARRSSLTGTG